MFQPNPFVNSDTESDDALKNLKNTFHVEVVPQDDSSTEIPI